MSTRFVTNAIVAVAAGFLVVASQAFSSPTTGWIAFDIALGIVAIVAAWTIVASVVFHGTTLKWLSAGEALALVALALAGLTYNEVREQKAVRAASGTSMGESLRAAA